jgi:hypothetical protein
MFVVSYAGNQRARDAVRQFELGWESALGDTITRQQKDSLRALPKRTLRAHVVIASYQTLRTDLDFFQSVHWQVLVADEVSQPAPQRATLFLRLFLLFRADEPDLEFLVLQQR